MSTPSPLGPLGPIGPLGTRGATTDATTDASTASDAAHQALQDLLPWYASGALGEAEAVGVQEHLPHCAACRKELAWQRKLLETEGPLPAGLDPERALARLMPRLAVAPAAMPVVASPAPWRRLRAWLGSTGWQGWAIGAQFAVIAVLATVQWLPPRAAAPIL